VIFWSSRHHWYWFQNSAPRPANQASVPRSDRVSGSAHDVRIGSTSEELTASTISLLHPWELTRWRRWAWSAQGQQLTSAGGASRQTRVCHYRLIPRAASYGRDLRALPQEPLSRVECRLERVRFSWTSGKRAVASAVAITDSWAYGHRKLDLRCALTAPANASEGADLRATSPARRCLASRLYGIRADDLLRRARIGRRRDDPRRCRRC
jgi:hypothetical protein